MNKLRALIWSYRGVSPLPYVTTTYSASTCAESCKWSGLFHLWHRSLPRCLLGALSCLQACLQSPLPGIVVTRGAGLANHNAALPACLCLYKKARTGPSEHTSTSTKSSTSTNRKWACNFPWSSIRTLEKTFPPTDTELQTVSVGQFLGLFLSLEWFFISFRFWDTVEREDERMLSADTDICWLSRDCVSVSSW